MESPQRVRQRKTRTFQNRACAAKLDNKSPANESRLQKPREDVYSGNLSDEDDCAEEGRGAADSDDDGDASLYRQLYWGGVTLEEPLFPAEVNPLLKETHVTSRAAIALLLGAAALLFCVSVSGLLQALAYRGPAEPPPAATDPDEHLYFLYGDDGEKQNFCPGFQGSVCYQFTCGAGLWFLASQLFPDGSEYKTLQAD